MRRALFALFLGMVLLVSGCGNDQTEGRQLTAKSGGYTAILTIAPGTVGPNTYTVSIYDQKQQEVASGAATLHFGMRGMEHGTSELALMSQPDGTWTGNGPHLMMEGTWQLQLVWEDEQGTRTSFDYEITLNQ
jgi:nitrogen fixation protein FixH